MNAARAIATAAALIAVTSSPPASAGSFREWLLADAPAWMQDPRPAERVALDEIAEGCLACHDGKRAGAVRAHARGHRRGRWSSGAATNHPVGMSYALAAARNPRAFVPAATLDPSIRLVGGRVSCISCHQVATHDRQPAYGFVKTGFVKTAWSRTTAPEGECTATGRLTVPGRTTDLCLSCHIK